MRGRDVDKRLFTARTLGLDTSSRSKGHTGVSGVEARVIPAVTGVNYPATYREYFTALTVNLALTSDLLVRVNLRSVSVRARCAAAFSRPAFQIYWYLNRYASHERALVIDFFPLSPKFLFGSTVSTTVSPGFFWEREAAVGELTPLEDGPRAVDPRYLTTHSNSRVYGQFG